MSSTASAIPDSDLVEYISGCLCVDGIVQQPFALDRDGFLNNTDAHGLGVQLDRHKVAPYCSDAAPLFAG